MRSVIRLSLLAVVVLGLGFFVTGTFRGIILNSQDLLELFGVKDDLYAVVTAVVMFIVLAISFSLLQTISGKSDREVEDPPYVRKGFSEPPKDS